MNQAEAIIFGREPAAVPSLAVKREVSTCAILHSLIADTYRLLVNTQGVRWNVTGPRFHAVRAIALEHTTELFEALETIAERLKALGHPVPQRLDELLAMSAIEDPRADDDIEAQVHRLADSSEHIADQLAVRIRNRAKTRLDPKTTALLTDRIGAHERYAWMWRAVIQ